MPPLVDSLSVFYAAVRAAIIGAGVLGLPESLAWLGWIAGLVALTAFFAVSLWAAMMLTEVYMVRLSSSSSSSSSGGGGGQRTGGTNPPDGRSRRGGGQGAAAGGHCAVIIACY
jgi:hypothetical protein